MNSPEVQYCDLRQDLAEDYATAARFYAEAVVSLTKRITRKQNFEYLQLQVKYALERAEQARAVFEAHVISHDDFRKSLAERLSSSDNNSNESMTIVSSTAPSGGSESALLDTLQG